MEKNNEQLIAEASAKITALATSLPGSSPEKRAEIKKEITRLSELIRDCARSAAMSAASSPTFRKGRADTSNEATVDFWDLGNPKPRVYKKPDFDGHTVGTTPVDDHLPHDIGRSTVESEKIPPRGNVESSPAQRHITGSYRRNFPARHGFYGKSASNSGISSRRESKIVREYSPGGTLIHKVTVRTWETEVEFFGRFISDALASHRAPSRFDPDAYIRPMPYPSYVPQYAHMGSSQVDYYRWLRENIRRGHYPDCDLGYLQLYLYEIFNLPAEIAPEKGVGIIAAIWLNYRERHPRLDGYLCEWMADYCLTNGCSLPRELYPILSVIAPKAQLKEFYIDPIITRAVKDGDSAATANLGKTVIEVASDYDYTSARYYADNRVTYDEHVPLSVGLAIKTMLEEKIPPFSLDRVHKMTRDSFSGAIISAGVKKRVDLEFSSFTRRADVRDAVTALVKYSENKLRIMLGIKSKLRVENLPPASVSAIDSYFRPLIPESAARSKEDEFMPRDYLKLYEAEDSGFDFGKAAEIERQSWVNTERLTGEEYVEKAEEYLPDEEVILDGEITADDVLTVANEEPKSEAISVPSEADGELKQALTAALRGQFRPYCREHGLYDGEVADKLNTLFLDIIGDVILEDSGAGYQIIEDYREDAENWLQTQ